MIPFIISVVVIASILFISALVEKNDNKKTHLKNLWEKQKPCTHLQKLPYLKFRCDQPMSNPNINSKHIFPNSFEYLGYEVIEEFDFLKSNIISNKMPLFNYNCIDCLTELDEYLEIEVKKKYWDKLELINSKKYHEEYIDGLSPYEFEKFVLDIYEKKGYQTEYTKGSDDSGVDGILYNNLNEKIIVQCKKYKISNVISPKFVRELVGTVTSQKAKKGIFITTSSFSKKAYQACEDADGLVELIDGYEFLDLVINTVVDLKNNNIQTFENDIDDEDIDDEDLEDDEDEEIDDEELEGGDGQQESEISYKDGQKYELSKTWYKNGQQKSETNYKDGLWHGRMLGWYENGKKNYEWNYKDENEHGKFIEWYKNGQQKSETNYKDGLWHGKFIEWSENGQQESEINYKDGQKHGLEEVWYENGKKEYEKNHKNARKHGKWRKWYRNGQQKSERNYIGDVKHGLEKTWYENVQNNSLEIELWDNDGYKDHEINYKEGKKNRVENTWLEQSQLKCETNYIDGMKDGLEKTWHKNGQQKSKVNYIDNLKHGLEKIWFVDGQQESETNYKNGKKHGLEKLWKKNGQQKSETNYANGMLWNH